MQQSLSIMFVDDEKLILDGLKKLYSWEKNGYTLIGEAVDGIAAIELALKIRPDIILLDINIPFLNGLEVIKKLKPALAKTKYIIVSGYDDYKLMRTAIKLQTSDYLLKPIQPNDLHNTLQHVREEIFDQLHSTPDIPPEKETEICSTLYEQMVSYIDEHLAEKLTLSRLSQEFNMSTDYISIFFKKMGGINFTDYLNTRRVARAKVLLKTTDLSIGNISEYVGFSDYRYFNKVFRNYLHMTPSQYRLEHKN